MLALNLSPNSVARVSLLALALAAWQTCDAQTALTWQQVREKFEVSNPTLKAAEANIAESKANEVTAYLRPNPDVSGALYQYLSLGLHQLPARTRREARTAARQRPPIDGRIAIHVRRPGAHTALQP